MPRKDKQVKIPKSWKFKTEFPDEVRLNKLKEITGEVNQKLADDNAALLTELGVIKTMLING